MIKILNFRHQRLPEWDGFGYNPINTSTGGCSSLGLDSSGKFGLVHKATENTGGIYQNTFRDGKLQQRYVKPLHIRNIPALREYFNL